MEGLFLSLWNRGAAAGWLILAILLLRLALQRAPKSVRPALWFLAAVRLVCPSFGESPLSLLPSAETVPQAVLERDAFYVNSGLTALNSTVNEQLVDYYETTPLPAGHTKSVLSVCAAGWIAGMVLMAVWAFVSWLRLRRRVAEAVPEGEGVWLCDRIGSPFLLGLVHPRIYLPAGLDGESRTYVLAHERAHIRRRDHWVKPVGFLLLAAYWFNPLLWLAYVLLCRDIELACDERVIRELGSQSKKPYSQALLRCSVHRGMIAACPLAFGEVGVKERVKNVLNYKKPAFWVILVSLALCAAAAVCFLTDPVTRPPEASVPEPDFSGLSTTELQKSPGMGSSDGPAVYSGGALLYQNPALSSYFSSSGGLYTSVMEDGDTLRIVDSEGSLFRYTLEETVHYRPEELYDDETGFMHLAEEEAHFGRKLIPEDAEQITRRTYLSEEPSADGPYSREAIWEVTLKGGGKRMWIGGTGRLFALVNPREQFQFFADVAALWTYDPQLPTAIPVRFEMDAAVSARSGTLALDPRSEEWTELPLTVEAGQTVYWRPADPGEALVTEAALQYSFPSNILSSASSVSDSISLRPAMDYEGIYGGRTYGISQDWLGLASSRFHETYVRMDAQTGALVVSDRSLDAGGEPAGSSSDGGGGTLYGELTQDFVTWDADAGK